MKLPANRIEAFLRKPDPALRAVLIYGPDAGLVRERATQLAHTVVEDLGDPFRVAVLSAASLANDPARLQDEAAALSMIGGRRVVRIRDGEERLAPAFSRFFADPPPGDSLVVVEAGELDSRSRLRGAFESALNAAAIPCYVEAEEALERVVVTLLKERGLEVDADAQAFLAAHLVGDRQVARLELDKLALYVGTAGKRVTLDDARVCIGDSAALELDDIVWAAAEGGFATLDRTLERLFAEGLPPVTVLRAALRHFQRLHLVKAQTQRGTTADIAVKGLKPPVFFKYERRFLDQVRRWSLPGITQVLGRLAETEADCKRTGNPDELLTMRVFFQIAALARAARR